MTRMAVRLAALVLLVVTYPSTSPIATTSVEDASLPVFDREPSSEPCEKATPPPIARAVGVCPAR